MNSKQRKQLKKKGPSKAAFNLLLNEFQKWYSTVGKDHDVVSVEVDGKRVSWYELARIWLKTKPDYYLDILTQSRLPNWYDHHLEKAVNDEVQERFEHKMLGTATDTDTR